MYLFLGASSNVIDGAEMKSNRATLGSYKVNTGHLVTVSGTSFYVGSSYPVDSYVSISETTYLCESCFWGSAFCDSCDEANNHRVYSPCAVPPVTNPPS
jgi:hypothetical protein